MKLVLLKTDIPEILHQITYFFLVQLEIKIIDLKRGKREREKKKKMMMMMMMMMKKMYTNYRC
jgi:hypothetical protein